MVRSDGGADVAALGKLWQGLREIPLFIWYVCRRYWNDHCFSAASSLSYNLLFAMIPVVAVGFAILTAFRQFDEIRAGLQDILVRYLLPQAGEDFGRTVDELLRNTQNLTGIGTVALALTAVILLDTVETKFNHIWRQSQVRPLVARVTMYWAILTMTPLLVGGSAALSSLLVARGGLAGLELFGIVAALVWAAPFALMMVAFWLSYIVIPYRRVRLGHAAIGAAAAALLYQGLRSGFTLYIQEVPTYKTLYGALSAIPIFLLWVYLVWCVVLFGAEIAAALPEWRRRPGAGTAKGSEPARRLIAALLMLERLCTARASGAATSTDTLADVAAEALADSDRGAVQSILDRLSLDRVIGRAEPGGWYMTRDPAQVRLADLLGGLDLGLGAAGDLDFVRAAWRGRVAAILAGAGRAEHAALAQTLEELFGPPAPAEAPTAVAS
jgi:membrane protein